MYKLKHNASQKLTGGKGDTGYKIWAQGLKLFAAQVNPKIRKVLTWAEAMKAEEITQDKYDKKGCELECGD